MLVIRAYSASLYRNIIVFTFRTVQALSSFFIPILGKVTCHTFLSIKERSCCCTIFLSHNRNRFNSCWLNSCRWNSCWLNCCWLNSCWLNGCWFDSYRSYINCVNSMARIWVQIKPKTFITLKASLFVDIIVFIIWAWLTSLFIIVPVLRKVTNNALFSIKEWSWWRTILDSSDNLYTFISFYIQLESFSTSYTVSLIRIIIGIFWTFFTSLIIFIPVGRKNTGNTFLSIEVWSLLWAFRSTNTCINCFFHTFISS